MEEETHAELKFEHVDLDEFEKHNCWTLTKFIFMFVCIAVNILAYIADLCTAAILLVYSQWSLSTQPVIPMYISRWIFVACILLSFLFLALDVRKARIVLADRYVAEAATSPIAYRWLSLHSYRKYCLLSRILKTKGLFDMVAFFVFFALKDWKRVLIAQSPRQIIAGMTVYALLKTAWTQSGQFHFSSNLNVYGADWQQRFALALMSATCIIWIITMLLFFAAGFLYVIVIFRIQGNLKEYCCKIVNKRTFQILTKNKTQFMQENGLPELIQPTLPQISANETPYHEIQFSSNSRSLVQIPESSIVDQSYYFSTQRHSTSIPNPYWPDYPIRPTDVNNSYSLNPVPEQQGILGHGDQTLVKTTRPHNRRSKYERPRP